MTLLDISNQIISKLGHTDFITKEILLNSVKINEEFDSWDAIYLALEDLEKKGILSKLKDKDIWVLRQPLNMNIQEVDISMGTANEITEIINSYLDARNIPGQRADKTNIGEQEIIMVINILNELLSNDPSK